MPNKTVVPTPKIVSHFDMVRENDDGVKKVEVTKTHQTTTQTTTTTNTTTTASAAANFVINQQPNVLHQPNFSNNNLFQSGFSQRQQPQTLNSRTSFQGNINHNNNLQPQINFQQQAQQNRQRTQSRSLERYAPGFFLRFWIFEFSVFFKFSGKQVQNQKSKFKTEKI